MRRNLTRHLSIGAIIAVGLAGCASAGSSVSAPVTTVAPPTTAAPTTASVGPAVPSTAVHLVDVAQATTLAADPTVTIVDVRTPAEFADGHIDRAQLVDFTDPSFTAQISQLDRSATYLVYCHSGNRSGQATAVMAQLGFTNVSNLDGGISAWQAAGAPIVK